MDQLSLETIETNLFWKLRLNLLIFKHMLSTRIYVPGSENRLQMIEDCDEEDKSTFQKISDSQEPTNNDINYGIYSWAKYSIKYANMMGTLDVWNYSNEEIKQSFKVDTYLPKANNIQRKSYYNSNFFSPETIELKNIVI